MNKRVGDRHRNRVRTYLTGAEKKRKAKEESRQADAEIRKSRKISDYVICQKLQDDPPQTPQECASCSIENAGNAKLSPAEVAAEQAHSEVEADHSDDADLVAENEVEDEDVNAADSRSSEQQHDCVRTAGEDDGPPGGNDIGLWPTIIPEKMRDYWVINGISTIQHCDEELFAQHSVKQSRTDRDIPRICSSSLFRRQNHNGEVANRNWLCFSPVNGRVFCFTCRLMCSDALHSQSLLIGSGICNWKHALERIRSHEQSKEHIDALIAFNCRLKVAGRMDTKLARQVEQLEQYWKSVLKRAVSVIKFIAERGLAFRGDTELIGSARNGNYLGILELIAQYDVFLAQHIQNHGNRGGGHTNYLSSTIMEELISVMGKQVKDEIISRVKRSKYYSVSLDSTTDESHVDQLTLVLRYIENDTPVERFVTFMGNKGHRAQEMFDALIQFLREHDLDIRDCRGQSYDNASVMSGIYNGLQAKVIEMNSVATWIPCTAHSLNLVGKNAAECCSSAVYFFDFLEKLYVFFTNSTHRYQVLTDALKAADVALTVKRVTTTRWSCRADATKALKLGYHQIKTALEQISDDVEEKACVRCEAEGLVARLNQLETGIYTVFWNDILQRVDATNRTLQSSKLDLNTAVASLTSLKDFVSSKRDYFSSYEKQGEELCGTSNYVQTVTRKRRRNVRLDPLDYGRSEETQLNPTLRYKAESYLPVIDQFIASLDVRLQAYKLLVGRFGCFGCLSTLSSEELRTAAKTLVDAYPNDIDNSFGDELYQFAKFADLFKDDEPENMSTELFLYKLIIDKGVQDTFPNVAITLRMYLVLMVTNCSAERSFSKLKLIENRLRTSMTQERLVHLAIMSLESDILREIDFTAITRDFAAAKSRKVSVF